MDGVTALEASLRPGLLLFGDILATAKAPLR